MEKKKNKKQKKNKKKQKSDLNRWFMLHLFKYRSNQNQTQNPKYNNENQADFNIIYVFPAPRDK
jgi:hypothetical protein